MTKAPFGIDPTRPFCLLRRKNEGGVWAWTGEIVKSRSLDEIPRRTGTPGVETVDTISLVPFSQARERGFPVHDGGESIITLVIEDSKFIDLADALAGLPLDSVEIGAFTFHTSADEYERIIRGIVEQEIGGGEGANFVIARRGDATLENFSGATMLAIFRALLVHEFGTYWTFLYFDGESYVVGATPERHISMRGGEVMMNPISGTFRKSENTARDSDDFLAFLRDEKETFELFMVTDEELKIMCELCDKGGAIVGPLLKEMSKVVHTEYLLLGRSGADPVALLRESMFAPTVTGSPVQSAFRIIERYERESRGYYGATIALIGRDRDGQPTLDAPITIRTLEVDRHGKLVARVGATLVRGSDPASEVKETEAKIAGVLAAIRATGSATPPPARTRLLEAVDPETVQILLQHRNLYLSRFWFEPQSVSYNAVPELVDKTVVIVDAEDSFSNMLKRMIEQMGARVRVIGWNDDAAGSLADIVVVGPGPGNPVSPTDRKMARMRSIIAELRTQRRPFLAECLSHQILCAMLGFPVVSKKVPFQGAQVVIDLFGRIERVGFYNTFVALHDREIPGIEVAADRDTGEIHAVRGEHFVSVQFHPESILSPRGYELVRDALVALVPPSRA